MDFELKGKIALAKVKLEPGGGARVRRGARR